MLIICHNAYETNYYFYCLSHPDRLDCNINNLFVSKPFYTCRLFMKPNRVLLATIRSKKLHVFLPDFSEMTIHTASRFMRKIVCRLRPNEVTDNRGVVQIRLQVLHVHVFLFAPLGVPTTWRSRTRNSRRETSPPPASVQRSITLLVRMHVQRSMEKSH